MQLQNVNVKEMPMVKQAFFSDLDGGSENGRIAHTKTAQSSTRANQSPREKSGALTLTRTAYGLPENDLPGIVPLHLNENLFNAAKAAVDKEQMEELITTQLENLHRYPINGIEQLQTAIVENFQVAPNKIVIAPGSSALLRNLILYLLKENDTILVPDPGWSYYRALTALVDAQTETFPLREAGDRFVYDKRIIANKIEMSHPKVVLICSPNNPTGNVMPIADFLWLVRRYPHVDFILDEAYYGFQNSYSVIQERELLDSTAKRNLFVVRTLSKFYGLANLRLGFLICSEADARNLQQIAPVFGLPTLNQAVAAQRLSDKHYWTQMQQEYAEVNAYLFSALQQIPGFTPYQTGSNFMLVRHDGRWSSLETILLDYGYKIKRETIKGARNYLRITMADRSTMEGLMAVIRQLAKRETAVTPTKFNV